MSLITNEMKLKQILKLNKQIENNQPGNSVYVSQAVKGEFYFIFP